MPKGKSSCHVLTHDPQRGGYCPRSKDEEMTTEKLSNLSKVTLLVTTGLDPDPGHVDFRGCIPNPCTAKECGQLQLCNKTVASLRLVFLSLRSKMDSCCFF